MGMGTTFWVETKKQHHIISSTSVAKHYRLKATAAAEPEVLQLVVN